MSITLTPNQEQIIEGAIRAGLARSVDEFIEKAVKVFRSGPGATAAAAFRSHAGDLG